MKKQGLKVKPKANGDVMITKETITQIKNNILPYRTLGLKFRTINVFWNHIHNHPSHQEGNPDVEEDSSMKSNGTLTAARPPDGIFAPVWRYCHMGILLQAFNDPNVAAVLSIAIHLHTDGIRMTHSFGEAPQGDVVNALRDQANDTVYSAGVMRNIDVELSNLLDFVISFENSGYSVIGFNCQHFTSCLYHDFTGEFLSINLRRRWTSNKGVFGNPLNDSEQKEKSMRWASASKFLMEQLEPVEGEPLLFYRSPPAFGGMMKVATVVGAAAASLVPAVALAVFTGAVVSESNLVRRFERSVIWFKYCENRNEWYWTPYRDQEYHGDDFWISVHQLSVPGGPFAGSVLQRKSSRIASILANNHFNPYGVDGEEVENDCPICLESKPVSMFVSSGNCRHTICPECFEQLDVCPFCRVLY